ncbi:MAG: phosphoribosylamine--glycine ligase [Bacteroidia bacterium]|nr:phosphoribosylamine--glycine ligase [Bacteroidia bacterium]MDW8302490.1 phosphoribosylamine--glycine ligase [Bacteroidia bacterium]
MKVAVIGSGAREHALAHAIQKSPRCEKVYAIPGNPGMSIMKIECVYDISANDFERIKSFCKEKEIDFLVVGPEAPLVQGIADIFKGEKTFVIGPNARAAQLEGSKSFTKSFLTKYQIPTASYKVFHKSEIQQALEYIKTHSLPVVLKADGLAAGKGVIIAQTQSDAQEALLSMMQQDKFGKAGHTVVIEEFMQGIELSAFVLCDGKYYTLLPEAKDYKRIGEGDTGLNTGGMGAVSPVPFADEAFMKKVETEIVQPTIRGLIEEGIEYVGILFIGLMNVNGNPKVVEFNCRFGDPEAQVILQRVENDWIEIFEHIRQQTLHECRIKIKKQHAIGIVLASQGYPEQFETGKIITNYHSTEDYVVYHAGTKWQNGQLVNAGGRVMSVVAQGDSLSEAKFKALKGAAQVQFENKYYRKDIGFEFLN